MTSRFLATAVAAWPLVGATLPALASASPPAFERPAADFIAPPTVRPPPPDDPADTCAVVPDLAPDFALEDVNPTSPSYGTTVQRTETPGDVTLLYVALASCAHCQADVDLLGALVAEKADDWAEVSVRVIALDTAHDSLPELADGHDLPILLDTEDVDVEGQYGAERWYIYLLDRRGMPRHLHYSLSFSTETDRLVTEVDALLAEDRP